MLDFRRMIEILESRAMPTGTTDPVTMARTWERLAPGNPAQNLLEMDEVWRMAFAVSDNGKNRRLWQSMVVGSGSPDDLLVYSNRLGAITKVPDILGHATGAISAENPGFYCEPRKRPNFMAAAHGMKAPGIESHVHVAPPPLEYDNRDRAMLVGIIVHELRHAMDFHEMGDTMGQTSYNRNKGTHVEIDIDEYGRNVLESRAHADQVKSIIQSMGGGERARSALRETTLAGMFVPRLRESMLELIDLLCGIEESYRPEVQVRVERDQAEQAVAIIREICESFEFRKYVR